MAQHFNIPLEDTVAIGDENNDIPMFKVAGLSISMGNALDKACLDLLYSANARNSRIH